MKVVDMHCDTIMKIFDSEQAGESEGLEQNSFQLDKNKLLAGDYLLQNFAMYIDKEGVDDPYRYCLAMIDCFYQEMELNKDWIAPVTNCQQILENERAGRISAMLTMEEGAPVQGDCNKLVEFYDQGVRMMTLTWNYPNEIGYPNAIYFDETTSILNPEQQGLTERGIEIVQDMNRLGMIVDVSHSSDQLVRDVLKYTKGPFVASHSDAREVCMHPRNLSDDLIRQIADRGGVIGMNYSDEFIHEAGSTTPVIDCLVKHIEHFRNVGGIDCVGLGSDFDGIHVYPELADASYMPKLVTALERAGFTGEEIEKIFHKNVLRLYKECLK